MPLTSAVISSKRGREAPGRRSREPAAPAAKRKLRRESLMQLGNVSFSLEWPSEAWVNPINSDQTMKRRGVHLSLQAAFWLAAAGMFALPRADAQPSQAP